MSRQRTLPHVDPAAPQGPLRRAALRLLSTNAMVALEGSLIFQLTAWRFVPILMRLTGGRLAALLPFPTGVIETRDARNGRQHRRVVVYFHDRDRVTVIPSKAGLGDDPFWYRNALADPAVLFESQPFRAEPVADQAAQARLWELADRFYPPCVPYRRRAARVGRTIPILQLVPSPVEDRR
ncbi:MAG TPA: nitroreductase/quinone reductase family protein [Solirubrobacterales bacterium]|nr:nitroreductase/quinone reductase family protein [Solirubrobacterales bacterium]